MNDALAALMTGGLIGLTAYCMAKGEPIPTEAQMLQALREVKPRLTQTIHIDTTQAHSNQPYPIAGQSMLVLNPATPSLPVYIRLNEPESDQIELTKQRTIKAPFYRFFITNAVGVGTLTIIVNKASAVELNAADVNVNIIAQTISNLLMTFNAQNVGVYLQPEWAALKGTDISLNAFSFTIPPGDYAIGDYMVPTGKTLYINVIEGHMYGTYANDKDAPQVFEVELSAASLGGDVDFGGNGGMSIVLSRPLVVESEDNLLFYLWNWSHHNGNGTVTLLGYLV